MALCSARVALRARATLSRCQPRRLYYYASEQEPQKLETQEDWTAFQLKRADKRQQMTFWSNFGSNTTRDNSWQPHHQLHRPIAPRDLTLNALVAAGAHFGHSHKLLNPNFTPYAYGTRAGITIIDLEHTLAHLRRAAAVVRSIVANDGTIVFVGTRPDLAPTVRKAASRLARNAYYVDEKWLAGTFTNRVVLHGIETTDETRIIPDCVILLNPIANLHAIRECAIENVPTIGLVDSNVDPRIVMYPIPANDESTRTAELIAGVLSIAAREGLALQPTAEQFEADLTESLKNVDLDEDKALVGGAEDGELEEADGWENDNLDEGDVATRREATREFIQKDQDRAERLARLDSTASNPAHDADEDEASLEEIRRNSDAIEKMKAQALGELSRVEDVPPSTGDGDEGSSGRSTRSDR